MPIQTGTGTYQLGSCPKMSFNSPTKGPSNCNLGMAVVCNKPAKTELNGDT